MNWYHRCLIALTAIMLTQSTDATGQTRQRFLPNYVTSEEVVLSSPNGNPRDRLEAGTLVAAREMGEVLDVKTRDGRFGLADRRYFSRLGRSIRTTPETATVAKGNNQLAFDIYRRAGSGNLFFSPASISTALAMTYAGARGETASQMASVLHFESDADPHAGFATLLEVLNSAGARDGYSLRTANRLWGAEQFAFEDDYLQLTRDRYLAPLERLNFRQTEAARRTINSWVEDQTRKKIVDLIPAGMISGDTKLVLTNAVHFKGNWSSQFKSANTKDAAFHVSSDERLMVPMMFQQTRAAYAEDDDVQVVSLPYQGNELSMVVVLPKQKDGLPAVEAGLTAEKFSGWTEKLQGARPVRVHLPKFRLVSQFQLGSMLRSLGMPLAFSPAADFSGMSKDEALMISEVVHKAFVDVDEKGTEAAAATAVVMRLAGAAPDPTEPVTFRADHPFMIAIRHQRTGAILFLGRIDRP